MSKLLSRFKWFLLCGAVGVLPTAWSADLTRDAALTKISMAFKLPHTVFADLPSAYVVGDLGGLLSQPLIEDLQSKGLVTATEKTGLGIVFPMYDVQLTEAGSKWLAATNASAKTGKVYRVAICDLAMNSVTGILLNSDKSRAEVHFNMKVSKVSGFAGLSPTSPCYEVRSGKGEGPAKDLTSMKKVNMALFDDGWRVLPPR